MPLEDRGVKNSEHIIIAKYMAVLRSVQKKGCVRGRLVLSARIEWFFRDYDVSAMAHFKDDFEKLDALGILGTDGSTSACVLHCARTTFINQRID